MQRNKAHIVRPRIPGKYNRRKHIFHYKGEPGANVFVAGDFNGWNPTAKQMKDSEGNGFYSAIVYMLPGRHEYKFIVNGIWMIDPTNPEHVNNGVDSLNSVLELV